jgi:YgiT-type zinc finger domain-containing protein
MKCVICHGDQIALTEVNEEIRVDSNVIYVPIRIPVCQTCGERYYDRRTMRFLEDVREKANAQKLELREVGKVLVVD